MKSWNKAARHPNARKNISFKTYGQDNKRILWVIPQGVIKWEKVIGSLAIGCPDSTDLLEALASYQ